MSLSELAKKNIGSSKIYGTHKDYWVGKRVPLERSFMQLRLRCCKLTRV